MSFVTLSQWVIAFQIFGGNRSCECSGEDQRKAGEQETGETHIGGRVLIEDRWKGHFDGR